METEWANALNANPPKSVYVKIEPIYEAGNSIQVSFDVEYTI